VSDTGHRNLLCRKIKEPHISPTSPRPVTDRIAERPSFPIFIFSVFAFGSIITTNWLQTILALGAVSEVVRRMVLGSEPVPL